MKILRKLGKRDKNGLIRYFHECECICGKIFQTRADSKTRSCGCLRSELNRKKKLGYRRYNKEKSIQNLIETAAKKIYKSCYDDGDISFEDFLNLSQKPCHYCGTIKGNKTHCGLKKDGTPRIITRYDIHGRKYTKYEWGHDLIEGYFEYNGLDRVDSNKKHTKDNCVPCCKTCNLMKINHSQKFFVEHIGRIFKWQQMIK